MSSLRSTRRCRRRRRSLHQHGCSGRADRARRQRAHHLQHRAAGCHFARTLSQRRPRPGHARLCGGAPRARYRTQSRPQHGALHRRRRTHRPDHGGVRVADRPRRHQRGRAELPVRSRQPRKAAAEIHRPHGQGRPGARQQRRIFQRHAAVDFRRHDIEARRTAACRLLPHNTGVTLPEPARRADHAPDAGMGHQRAEAAGTHRTARVVSDHRHHVVDGLQPHLFRRRQRQRLQARHRRLGQHHQPVRRELSRSQTQADRRRRAARAARRPRLRRSGGTRSVAMEDKAAGFEEKAFFEYHLYTLGRPTTLPDNSTKQIELFPAARDVPCEKTLVYYGSRRALRLRREPDHRSQLRRAEQQEGRRLSRLQELAGSQHGHAAAVGPHPRQQSWTMPTRRSSSSART